MTLEEMAREERNKYFREWRAKNKDKVRENNRRYWERRAAKMLDEQKREELDDGID